MSNKKTQELFDELANRLETTISAYKDNPEWHKEIERDIKKIINILSNWS